MVRDRKTEETSHTFENLEPGSTHTVSMMAIDNAGNKTEASNNGESITLEKYQYPI